MSTDSFDIPIQAQPNAQTVAELFDEAWDLIVLNIRKLAKGKPNKTIVESFLDLETKSENAGLSSASELRFYFRSPGGACDVQVQVCAHWFEIASALAHEELAKIGARLGYVVCAPKRSASELVDTPREVPFFPHGDAVLAVMRGESPMIASDDDGEVDLADAELPAAKKKLARALAESGICACGVCEAVRKGATPVAKKEKKEKAPKAGAPVERKHFTSLPKAMRSPDRVASLDISGHRLGELPQDIDKLAYLERIDARENGLREVPPALFLIPTLEFANLAKNPIRALPETLGRARTLRALSLSRTPLQWLPDCFGDLPDLETLWLEETQLAALPPSIVTLSKLKYLTLDECKALREPIPDLGALTSLFSLSLVGLGASQVNRIDYTRLTSLRRLNLKGNDLERVPAGVETLTGLTELQLDRNALTDLSSLAALANLESLTLSDNQLSRFPTALRGMPKMTGAYLGGNPLASLEGVGTCPQLKILGVGNEALTSVSEDIGELTALETLNLSKSPLTSLPGSMAKLRNLKSLGLASTKLTELPGWVGELTSLERLDISRTTISKLPDSMRNLAVLEELEMDAAGITTLPDWVFELPKLKKISAFSDQLDKPTLAKLKAKGIQRLGW